MITFSKKYQNTLIHYYFKYFSKGGLELTILKACTIGLLVGVLLAGCNTMEESEPVAQEEVLAESVETVEYVPIEERKNQAAFGEWVSNVIVDMAKQSEDLRLVESGHDEGFEYYLKTLLLSRSNYSDISKPYETNKDLANLFLLSSYIQHMQFVRTAHLGQNGEAIESVELAEQWKPVPEEMRQAYEYINQILSDLDVALNKGGIGETFRVTHEMNGDNVDKVEAFLGGE